MKLSMKELIETNYSIGQVVRHKYLDFRGVIFAENDDVFYTAYVSQQNLIADDSNSPVDHPDVKEFFGPFKGQSYEVRETSRN